MTIRSSSKPLFENTPMVHINHFDHLCHGDFGDYIYYDDWDHYDHTKCQMTRNVKGHEM